MLYPEVTAFALACHRFWEAGAFPGVFCAGQEGGKPFLPPARIWSPVFKTAARVLMLCLDLNAPRALRLSVFTT